MSRVNNTLKNKKKEPYMNVQDIIIEPGREFIQWKLMTKKLLKQRENELMNVRCDMTQSIISKAITQFAMEHGIKTNETFYFDETFKRNTLQELYKKIDAWNGVQVTRLKKKDMNSFKAYFVIGKNWLDQNKKKVWAPYFWIKIFVDIQKFVANMGNNGLNQKCLLLQKEYSHCLELKIMQSLFIDGTVQFIQTKQQPLIPHGTIKFSTEIQEYLLHLDKSLTIKNWCEKQTQSQKIQDALNKKKRKRTGNAKLLVKQLQQTLITLVSVSENKLLNINIYCSDITNCKHISLHASCTYVQQFQLPPKLKVKQQPKQPPKPPPPCEFIFEQIPQTHNIQQPICNTINTPPLIQQHFNQFNISTYYPHHSGSCNVSDCRFNPYHNINTFVNSVNQFNSCGCCNYNCTGFIENNFYINNINNDYRDAENQCEYFEHIL